jgi:alanyl-tRNA synthetase
MEIGTIETARVGEIEISASASQGQGVRRVGVAAGFDRFDSGYAKTAFSKSERKTSRNKSLSDFSTGRSNEKASRHKRKKKRFNGRCKEKEENEKLR